MQIEKVNGSVPNRISMIIKNKGLKQCSVAEKAGIKKSEFYAILGNRRIIKPYEINPIAKALGVDVGELFKSDSD